MIFSSRLYNNLLLTDVFRRLKYLHILSKSSRLLPRDTNKLIERFPSLVHLEFQLTFGKELPPLLDTCLSGLPDLVHIRVHFNRIPLVQCEEYYINYIAKKRRKAFPWIACNTEDISVQIVTKIVNIYLKGCSMCTNNTQHV